jgi:F-type H+-transporting ATPase subunit epsilon
LKGTVENQFTMLDEREKEARSAIAKFEADFARRFLELEK